jgi:iron complex outermembrane receptor protein
VNSWLNVGANIYFMDYKDQLVLTGELNEIGEPLAANIPDSYRAGVELMAGVKLPCGFAWSANAAFSRNRIENFTEVLYDDNTGERWEINHGDTRIAFSPDVVVNNSFSYGWRGLEASLQSQYVGKQYMSNANQEQHSLDAYFVSNLRLAYSFPLRSVRCITVGVTIYNLFNEEYENNGYAGSGYYTDDNGVRHRYNYAGYAAQAGTNALAHVSIEL